mgnify:CR=1 FL=1|tara:strand:- start:2882 stop:3202 length:321 start_codon:yes stop_codon:yes gene_type:complete
MSKIINSVYVISKTILANNARNICSADKEIHKIIGNASKKYIGCISSQNIHTNQRILINVSNWYSVQMWENWKNSSDRYYLKMDYKNRYHEEFKIIDLQNDISNRV